MTLTLRQASAEDIPALCTLCKEMEDHYQGAVAISQEEVRERLTAWFARPRDSVMLLAFENEDLLGHAVICPLFPAGDLNTAWFLKDIYVAASGRGQGVGNALIQECAAETVRRKGTRLDLTVDDGNDGARALYERLGAVDTRKSYLRWDGDALTELGKQAST